MHFKGGVGCFDSSQRVCVCNTGGCFLIVKVCTYVYNVCVYYACQE